MCLKSQSSFKRPCNCTIGKRPLIISGPSAPDGTPQGRQVQIPLRASVVAMNRSSPPRLIFGSISQPATRALRIYRQDKAAFRARSSGRAIFSAYRKKSVGRARPRSGISKSQFRPHTFKLRTIEPLRLQLKTKGQTEEFSVPIAAIIETIAPPGAAQAALLPRAEDDRGNTDWFGLANGENRPTGTRFFRYRCRWQHVEIGFSARQKELAAHVLSPMLHRRLRQSSQFAARSSKRI